MPRFKPRFYLISTILLSILSGTLVYALYPVSASSGYTIVKIEEGGEEVPGFMAGFKSVSSIKSVVTVEGIVYGHGFIYSGNEKIYYMDIIDETGRKHRVIIAPLAVEEEGILKIATEGREVEMPLMMKHKIEVRGVELRNGLIVAEEIEMKGMQGCFQEESPMRGMPMGGMGGHGMMGEEGMEGECHGRP
ncbi:MAG: hypothetical protein F7C07_00620 [Desulfurococcales archaeon]|nr:hypothetical protein [Desulfurococcales archaeon]